MSPKIRCPICEKNKIDIRHSETTFGKIDDVRGAKEWHVLLKIIDDSHWEESVISAGIVVKCKKCKQRFLVYSPIKNPLASTEIRSDILVPLFCETCQRAYVVHSLECPICSLNGGNI